MGRPIPIALAVLALLIGLTVAADRVAAVPTGPTVEAPEQREVTSGALYCVIPAGSGETATVTVAAVGEAASRVSITSVADGAVTPVGEAASELAPGENTAFELDGADAPPAVVIRWQDGPVSASWQTAGGADGRLGGTCAAGPSPKWLLPGANTVVGSDARLHLFNPFGTDAVVRIAYATPEGRIDLVSSENVPVPARSVHTVSITELQPEQPDLGIIVEVAAGRVIATGVQDFGQPDLPEIELEGAESVVDPNAPQGRVLLHATTGASTDVGFAYAASGQQTRSWVSVLNPSTRAATVAVTTSDQVGGDTSAQEVQVGPQSVQRIDLDGVSSAPNFGVVLRTTEGAGVVAQGFMSVSADNPAVTSLPGVGEADDVVVAPTVASGSAPEIALYNPGDAVANIAINAAGPEQSAESGGEAWTTELDPGQMQLLTFADADVAAAGLPVIVSADRAIYGALRLATDNSRIGDLLVNALVPAATWEGSAEALVPTRDRTLETRPVDFPAQPDR